MAKCHNSVDSPSVPRASSHSGVPGKSRELPVVIAGFPAALTTKPARAACVLVDNPGRYVGRTDSLRRRTEHSAVSGKRATLIPTSIA